MCVLFCPIKNTPEAKAKEGRDCVPLFWCEKRDLNPYGVNHTPLKRARLPVPPLSHIVAMAATDNIIHYFLKKSIPFLKFIQKSFCHRASLLRLRISLDRLSVFEAFCLPKISTKDCDTDLKYQINYESEQILPQINILNIRFR